MSDSDIIRACLLADVISKKAEIKSLRAYCLNTNFSLRASVLEHTVKIIEEKIKDMEIADRKPKNQRDNIIF